MRQSALVLGIVALSSVGAMGQQAAIESGRAAFGATERGFSFFPGAQMLAWDTEQLGDDALVIVGTAPPSFTAVTGDVPEIGIGPELEYGLDGVLYVNDTSNNALLHRLDPNTGAYLGVINLTFPPEGDVITSMEWVEGVLLCGLTTESGSGSFNTFLATIDPADGIVNVIGDTGINRPWGGIAYNGGEVVYVITAGGSNPELYIVSGTGVAALVGPVMENGVVAPGMTALEFGPDGQLYALPNNNHPNAGDLYLINPANAQALNLGSTGNTGLVALTTYTGCSDADLAAPFGVLDFSDVISFLTAFGAGCGL